MCTRLTLTMPSPHQVAEQLGIMIEPPVEETWKPRYNVAPTQEHPLLRADAPRILKSGKWGIGPHKQMNARAETILARKRTAAKNQQRCIVPATGFFEWSGTKDARLPWYITRRDGQLMLFAGLVDDEKDGAHFAVITTEPNALIARIHDRMPAILEPTNVQAWLNADNPDEARLLLRPVEPEKLFMHRVTTRVNKPANDDAQLIERIDDDEKPQGQLKLL